MIDQLVMSLTLILLVQAKQLNGSGELFLQKYPKLRVRLVDGSGLATAVVLKSIPTGTKQVFLCGSSSKVAHATATALCERGVQVIVHQKKEYDMLKLRVPDSRAVYLKFSSDEIPQVWIGDNIDDKQQRRASKGTIFIPTSQFPLKKTRKDCTYLSNPAMKIPETMQNVHTWCGAWAATTLRGGARRLEAEPSATMAEQVRRGCGERAGGRGSGAWWSGPSRVTSRAGGGIGGGASPPCRAGSQREPTLEQHRRGRRAGGGSSEAALGAACAGAALEP